MDKDNLYIFDKINKRGTILGEIQSNFNMALTIDGTKDSCSMTVYSYNDIKIEPYTICYHPKTQTWWIVSHDKVERHYSDSGFLYIHNLDLLGAIELLNARDLTDCGFNQNKYTIQEFLTRLIKLSTFEFNSFQFISALKLSKKVTFVKTFENYTLLSALREFLDAYNSCAKLEFGFSQQDNYLELTLARFLILSKTGDKDLPTHNISYFNDTRETKIFDKNSYGNCVITNAENVISTKTKTYPSKGGIKASSTAWEITSENAILRLPSKVFKGISLTAHLALEFSGFGNDATYTIYPEDIFSLNRLYNNMSSYVQNHSTQQEYQAFLNDFNSKKTTITENIRKASRVTIYEGNTIDPSYNNGEGKIIQGQNVPYLVSVHDTNVTPNVTTNLIFTDKATKETLPKPRQGIAWERGSNLITGFEGCDKFIVTSLMDTDYQVDNGTFYSYNVNQNLTIQLKLVTGPQQAGNPNIWSNLSVKTTSWSVTYIPMGDLKIKVDNFMVGRDTQLYNQNGRLTDSVALSKLINSYSKEISSENITRFYQTINYSNVPKVGSFVYVGNEQYVINNVSMTFTQNESSSSEYFDYYIECEITMSKWVSTKSLMVNPNTNIRDYGIPQTNNIKRKQLYRDYYELKFDTNSDANLETPYFETSNIFDFTNRTNELDNFIAVIKIGYEQNVDGQQYWYYQLETTNYYLDKMICVVLDFNDNNIIGYGSQNTKSGFDISQALSPSSWVQSVNTPISYVDSNGELKSIDMFLCSQYQLTNTYNYYSSLFILNPHKVDLYNLSVFIPDSIYTLTNQNNEYLIKINESNYYKDALEVPFFEYICQIDDSEDVLIGDGILKQHENCIYFYSYIKGTNLTQNNVNDTSSISISGNTYSLSNTAELYYAIINGKKGMRIRLFQQSTYNSNTNVFNDSGDVNLESGKDYAIFRHAYNLSTNQEIVDLMLIVKRLPQENIYNDRMIELYTNYYKLK